MMISKRNTILMFAVTMMSVFGMSYCCSGSFELPYINESGHRYHERTSHIDENCKVTHEEFDKLKEYYKSLIGKIQDLAIVKLLYAILPEKNEFEADFMDKILLLGSYCSTGVQTAVMRHYIRRLFHLLGKEKHFPLERRDALSLGVVQELLFLSDKMSVNTSKGRLQEIFMSTFHGNRYPMSNLEKEDHDLTGYSSHGGDFAYAPDEQYVKKVEVMGPDNNVIVQKKKHHPLNHIWNVVKRKAHPEPIHETPPSERSPEASECDTVTAECSGEVKINTRFEEDYITNKERCHKCWLKHLLGKLRHHFEKDHRCVEGVCEHTEMETDVSINIHMNLKVDISQNSEWLTDLKDPNPKFGEGYLTYAIRALKYHLIPLPKQLLKKYHGKKLALNDNFHVWPENNSVFILFFLFNCPVGEVTHLQASYGNFRVHDHDCEGECDHIQHESQLNIGVNYEEATREEHRVQCD